MRSLWSRKFGVVATGISGFAGIGAGVLLATAGRAAGDNINMSWTTVANVNGGITCVQSRAEIDHDVDQHHRKFWTARHRTVSGGVACNSSGGTIQMRLRGEWLYRAQSTDPYGLCTATVGDGLGDPGYIHASTSSMGTNSAWRDGGICGGGQYVAKTWGHVFNNGWIGGPLNSPKHDFK